MNASLRLLAGFCVLALAKLDAAGSLEVTLGPEQILDVGAHWRVDHGEWARSGGVVKDLSAGDHLVDFDHVPGWIAPKALKVSVTDDEVTKADAVYLKSASVQVTLTPSLAEWKVDSGPSMASGSQVTNLAPGNHTVIFQPLPGYQVPDPEIVNLSPGQMLTWARSYEPRAQLRLMLVPSLARWRVNGGAWQEGGAVVTDLPPGNYVVEYSSISGFKSPPSETFRLAAGEKLSPQRNYVRLAEISVVLDQPVGWWRIDGGPWQSSGATVRDLLPGSHTLSFGQLNGYDVLPDETISLSEGQIAGLIRNYPRRRP